MTISYPLDLPSASGFEAVQIAMFDVVAVDQSPFTLQQQLIDWRAQMWRGELRLPPLDADEAAEWEGWLGALRGQRGTFLLGDPGRPAPRGTATSGAVTGSAGAETVSVTLDGALLRGDVFQLGTGADATLHKVVQDCSGSGDMEIWPALRKDRTAAAMTLIDAKGNFRLASNDRAWGIAGGGWRSFVIPVVEAV